jgi:hypothetical protein
VKRLSIIAMILSLIFSAATIADPMPLDACKRLQSQIESYNDLRRKGGSGSQMESWKKSRKRLEEKFRAGECKRHGRAVW